MTQQRSDYRELADELEPLRALGIRIAVDDVGAGFSSFAHVLELRPDVLKLDRSIVTGIDGDLARQAIAAAVVDLGRRFDATVVAEGVETSDELTSIVSLGIELVQGYLFRRPGPLAESLDVDLPGLLGESIDSDVYLTSGQLAHRFELAMVHSPIGMALVTIAGLYSDANPALCDLLGVSRADLIGTSTSHTVHPDDYARDARFGLECIEGTRDTFRSRNRYIRSDSQVVDVEHSVVLVRSKRGKPLYFMTQVIPANNES